MRTVASASTGRRYVARVGGAVRGAGRPGRALEDARRGRGAGGGGPRLGPTELEHWRTLAHKWRPAGPGLVACLVSGV